MMKAIIFIVFLILVLLGVGYAYFEYEKPQTNLNQSKINILTEDKQETGYLLYVNNKLQKNGTTDKFSAVREEVPSNSTIEVMNYNINNQSYYTDIIKKDVGVEDNIRASFNLKKAPEFNIKNKQNLTSGEGLLQITHNSSEEIKNPSFCVSWDVNFLYVDLNNQNKFNKIKNPERFENYEKCFQLKENTSNNFEVILSYVTYSKLDKTDEIKLVFFDCEEIRGELKCGEELGAEDKIKRFINNN
ncbi:MAG: hypothetical protein ACOCRX_07675 [Candidatus Woesearchaeota archaeon]